MRLFHLLICLLVLLSLPVIANAEDDIDDVADAWVNDEIGRDPYVIDGYLSAPKDLLFGRQVSDVMGGILGRIYEAILREEGSFGHPNRRRGRCGSAAIRQASGIIADSSHSQMFRAFAGNASEIFEAIPGIVTGSAMWVGGEIAEGVEDAVRGHLARKDPQEYWLSKSQEGCTIEMRVVWKPADQKFKFMVMGDCQCNEVKCWNFEDAEIQLGRWSVSGEGSITPEIRRGADGDPEIHYNIGRVSSANIQVNADCCGLGSIGDDDSWVSLPDDEPAISVGQDAERRPRRPVTGGGSRPETGGGITTGGGQVDPPEEEEEPQETEAQRVARELASIEIRDVEYREINQLEVPEGPFCSIEEHFQAQQPFFDVENDANWNARMTAYRNVDIARALGGDYSPATKARLRQMVEEGRAQLRRDDAVAAEAARRRHAVQEIPIVDCDEEEEEDNRVSMGDDVEIELEGANTVEGENAFDAEVIKNSVHWSRGEDGRPTYTPPPPPMAPPSETPKTTTGTTVGTGGVTPPPTKTFTPTVAGKSFSINHIIRKSPCPQPVGVSNVSASGFGKVHVKVLAISGPFDANVIGQDSANPSVDIKFNCQVEGPGTYEGLLRIKVSDGEAGDSTGKNFDIRLVANVSE